MRAKLYESGGRQKLLIKAGQAGEIVQLAELFRKLADGRCKEAELTQELGMALEGTEAIILRMRPVYGKFMQDVQIEDGRVIWKADAEDWRDNADILPSQAPGHQYFGSALAAVEVEVSWGEEGKKIGVNWKLEIARVEFGFRAIESMPELACVALSEGADTPSLRILAGLGKGDNDEIRQYLRKTVCELGMAFPTREESAWELMRFFIEAIASGEMDPFDGLSCIASRIYRRMDWDKRNVYYVADGIGFSTLYGLYDAWDDLMQADHRWSAEKTNEELLEELRQMIVDEARAYRDGYLAKKLATMGMA